MLPFPLEWSTAHYVDLFFEIHEHGDGNLFGFFTIPLTL